MIKNQYSSDFNVRNNTTTRNEVFACVLIDNFICKNETLIVGDKPSLNLPDIYNETKQVGFEVTRCEADIDFKHMDANKEFVKYDYDYSKYLELKKDPTHIFHNIDLNIKTINNKIVCSSVKDYFHNIDWMKEAYRQSLNAKLKKLNNGNYKDCLKVSLVILNLARANGMINAKIVQQVYSEEVQNFSKAFEKIYYITTGGIYSICSTSYLKYKAFKEYEFDKYVGKMKQLLKIDQFAIK